MGQCRVHAARRACLSVPGADGPKLAKAGLSGADEIVLDLEDSVSPARKDDARAAVVSWLAAAGDRAVTDRRLVARAGGELG
jgi:citrate lyase subunit beta/citryl-CoA lyase